MPLQSTFGEDVLREIDEFFMREGPIHETLRKLAARLAEEKIDYALVGGMALALHGFVRPTQDVDLLVTPEGLERFHERLVGRGYVVAFPGARKHFRDADTGVPVEVITSGEFPGDGKPKPVVFPRPEEVAVTVEPFRVANIEKLVELKLASGLSAEHRRLRDLADVQQLIEVLDLPLELAQRLDASVGGEYEKLWHLARTARRQESESNER
ncbi:MAG TPA: nucleotidyltransferase family protein [Blastocatellia bacterium]|nr:nucleotidyltransferase family protein [Blastocatellia bacterium]